MKIYCAGPIRGDRSYAPFFRRMIDLIQELGHTPLTELTLRFAERKSLQDEAIYHRDLSWLRQSSALVAEVSAPSLGVGYEIAYALHSRKIPVLCLRHRSSKILSAMISGNSCDLLRIRIYQSGEELERVIREFLDEIDSE